MFKAHLLFLFALFLFSATSQSYPSLRACCKSQSELPSLSCESTVCVGPRPDGCVSTSGWLDCGSGSNGNFGASSFCHTWISSSQERFCEHELQQIEEETLFEKIEREGEECDACCYQQIGQLCGYSCWSSTLCDEPNEDGSCVGKKGACCNVDEYNQCRTECDCF